MLGHESCISYLLGHLDELSLLQDSTGLAIAARLREVAAVTAPTAAESVNHLLNGGGNSSLESAMQLASTASSLCDVPLMPQLYWALQ